MKLLEIFRTVKNRIGDFFFGKGIGKLDKICIDAWFGNVLEIGCGSGEHWALIKSSVAENKIISYTGLDREKDDIEMFRRRIKELPRDIVHRIVVGSAPAGSLIPGVDFDVVVIDSDHLQAPGNEGNLDDLKRNLNEDSVVFVRKKGPADNAAVLEIESMLNEGGYRIEESLKTDDGLLLKAGLNE